MDPKKIVIISASEVKNLELAELFRKQLEALHAEVSIVNLIELDLPLYTSRSETKFVPSELLAAVLPVISVANGFVFIAPEYNGGTPPAFNNFLAWLSRSSKHWRERLNGFPAAIATFSGGGGYNILTILRAQLSFIGMNVIGRQILASPQKSPDEESIKSVVLQLLRLCA